jgi:two-component system, OmpR family, phosphate regulon sensor histidine kinase PhoR
VSLADRLTRLGELLVAMSGSPVPTHLFQTLADEAGGALPNDYVAVCLADSERGGYLVHSLAALPDRSALTPRVFAPDEGVPGRAMRRGQACVVDDLTRADAGADDLEGALARSGLGSALVVPVRRGLEMLGALLFARRACAAFTQDDQHIATLIASGLSAALETSRAYQALADERSTLAAVLGSTADAVLMVNPDGIVLLANPAVQPMLGLVPETLLGRPLSEVVDDAAIRELFESPHGRPVELALADGRTAQATVVPVVTPYGETVGAAAVLRDITLLKNLQAMKDDFVHAVSHDLKSPISAIAGLAYLLQQDRREDVQYQSRLQRLRDIAKSMAELVSDLLDLGRIEAGLDPATERDDVVPLIETVVQTLAHEAEAKRITVETALPKDCWLPMSAARLRQALINLVGNAIKYTAAGGRVHIALAVTDAGSTATIAIRDTGRGIPVADLPHVFDKFYRVKNHAADGTPGTGLGLAIVKSIVDLHHGRVRVESVEGAGSTFFVELPFGER